jgi:hypothetical protein
MESWTQLGPLSQGLVLTASRLAMHLFQQICRKALPKNLHEDETNVHSPAYQWGLNLSWPPSPRRA